MILSLDDIVKNNSINRVKNESAFMLWFSNFFFSCISNLLRNFFHRFFSFHWMIVIGYRIPYLDKMWDVSKKLGVVVFWENGRQQRHHGQYKSSNKILPLTFSSSARFITFFVLFLIGFIEQNTLTHTRNMKLLKRKNSKNQKLKSLDCFLF